MRYFVFVLVLGLSLLSCKKEYKYDRDLVLTIYEGDHGAGSASSRTGEIDERILVKEILFSRVPSYDFSNYPDPNNQYDVNKLDGYRFHWWRRDYLTAMLGWRWDLDLQTNVLQWYCHGQIEGTGDYMVIHDGNTWISREYITAKQGDKITTEYQVNRADMRVVMIARNETTGESMIQEAIFHSRLGEPYEIWPWFGGQEVAPDEYVFFWTRLYQ